jgi:methyl-accepting chemotaxis protein
MRKEEQIQIAFEQVQQTADTRLTYAFYIFLPILFIVGAIYQQPVLALVGCLLSIGVLYYALTYIKKRKNRNIAVTWACFFIVMFMLFVTKGLSEVRYCYYIFLYLLALYRDRYPIILALILGLLYASVTYTVILSDNAFAPMAKTYLLAEKNVSIEGFVASLVFITMGAISALLVVDTLYLESMSAIENEITKEIELQNYYQNVQFADEIAAGNLDASYPNEADALGKSLLNMRENLKKADEKEAQERFISDTTAEIGEILRQHTQDIETLTDRVLTRLIQKLEASQGAIYMVQRKEAEPYLEMVACYAYQRKKYLYQRIEVGEGLIGQTYLEQLPTFITQIPKTYKPIEAGMGETVPTCLFITPLKSNERIVGVLEIASMKMLDSYERNFLEKIGDNIASTLITAINNQETQILYRQSQIATEELRTREEEMRQNMEELRTTQEEMQRTQVAMQESQMKSRAIFDGSINSIIIFNEQGWIEEINPATENMFGYDRNAISNMKIENLFAEFAQGVDSFIGLRSKLTAKKRNGETFPVQSFLNRFLIGTRPVMLIYSRDATKDVAREQENQQQIQQIELAKQLLEEQLRTAKIRETELQKELQALKNR